MPKVEEVKFARQIEAIVDSEYAAIEKLILLKIRLRCDHDTLTNAFPSLATLMRAASVKDDRTVREAIRELVKDGILTRDDKDRAGKPPSYGFSKERLQEVIAEYLALHGEKMRQRRPRPLPSDVGGTSDDRGQPVPSNGRGVAQDPPHPMGGVTSPDPSHPMGGVASDPSHFMQRPLPSNGSRPSITYQDISVGGNVSPTSLTTTEEGQGLNLGQRTRRAASPAPDEAELAVAFYNDEAEKHHYQRCTKLTPPLRRRLTGRLKDIGGLENFKRSVLAVPCHRFMSGRARPRPGDDAPFKLSIQFLLQTDGPNMGDVLATLLDLASDATNQSADDAAVQVARHEQEAMYQRLRDEEDSRC
jgi:hypothetical protein